MKAHFKTLVILPLLILIILVGCKKTDVKETPEEQKTAHKTVLNAVIKDDGKTEYQYNEFGQLERINRFSNATGFFEYLIYEYSDNQLKQIRRFGQDYESNEMTLQIIYKFSYQNNRVIRIEFYNENNEDVGSHLLFGYQNKEAATGPVSSLEVKESDYYLTNHNFSLDENSNIIKERTDRTHNNIPSIPGGESQFEYDNSINPLYGIDGFEKMLPHEYALDESFNLISFFSPNNCTKARRGPFELYGETSSMSSVYTYNENKMPLTLKTTVRTSRLEYVYDPENPGIDPLRMVTTEENYNQQFEYQTITVKVSP